MLFPNYPDFILIIFIIILLYLAVCTIYGWDEQGWKYGKIGVAFMFGVMAGMAMGV